jgi:SAM-dependent methyltransferase
MTRAQFAVRPAYARVQRILSVCRNQGLKGVTTKTVDKLREKFGLLSERQAAYFARKNAADEAFDAGGVDTSGTQYLHDLTIEGDNARHGVCHIACDPEEFAAAIADLKSDLAEYTFVDFGSGKGRALMMATDYPFRRIIGVEFAAELHATAMANLAIRPDPRIELINADATRYELPPTPLVLFLFNPFDASVVAEVARRALASWNENPRSMYVVYVNPLHQWSGWRETNRRPAHAILVPTHAGGA